MIYTKKIDVKYSHHNDETEIHVVFATGYPVDLGGYYKTFFDFMLEHGALDSDVLLALSQLMFEIEQKEKKSKIKTHTFTAIEAMDGTVKNYPKNFIKPSDLFSEEMLKQKNDAKFIQSILDKNKKTKTPTGYT